MTTKWGRNPRLWIAGGEWHGSLDRRLVDADRLFTGLFTFVVFVGLCIAILANRSSISLSRAITKAPYTNGTGWDSKIMVYFVGVSRLGVRGVGDACAQ